MHSRDPKNYYVLLGFDPYQRHTYKNTDIKSAYTKLALQYHPDRNRHDPETAAEKFKSVSEAYSVLAIPATRDEYDEDLAIENKYAFSIQRKARQEQAMMRQQKASLAKQRQFERELKQRPQKEIDLAQKEKEQKELEQIDLDLERLQASLDEDLDFFLQEVKLKELQIIQSLNFLIKLLVGTYISIKLLPRMIIEAFFGLFVVPLFIIFATEQAFSYIIPKSSPNKSYHPLVRAMIILLTLALLPLIMLLGAFVLPYQYFNKNEKAAAAETYHESLLYFNQYLHNKFINTVFVMACITIPAALFITFPPAGLLSLLGPGGTIATYLGLEAVSKSILVCALSGIVAVTTAIANVLVNKIISCLPQEPDDHEGRFRAYKAAEAVKIACESKRPLITYLGQTATYSPIDDAVEERKDGRSNLVTRSPAEPDSAVFSAATRNANNKVKFYHQPSGQGYFNFWIAPTVRENGNVKGKQNSKSLIIAKY